MCSINIFIPTDHFRKSLINLWNINNFSSEIFWGRLGISPLSWVPCLCKLCILKSSYCSSWILSSLMEIVHQTCCMLKYPFSIMTPVSKTNSTKKQLQFVLAILMWVILNSYKPISNSIFNNFFVCRLWIWLHAVSWCRRIYLQNLKWIFISIPKIIMRVEFIGRKNILYHNNVL